jgi:hypothetical protein
VAAPAARSAGRKTTAAVAQETLRRKRRRFIRFIGQASLEKRLLKAEDPNPPELS